MSLSQIILWCFHSRKQFDLEEDSFAFTSILFVVLEERLIAHLQFLDMGVILFFSGQSYVKHNAFHLYFSLLNYCFTFFPFC